MNNKPGFTLIELLIVLLIVGVLICIAVPAVQRNLPVAKQAGEAVWDVDTYEGPRSIQVIVPLKALSVTVKTGDLLIVTKSGSKALAEKMKADMDYENANVYEVTYADDTKGFCKAQSLSDGEVITVFYNNIKPDFQEGQTVYLYVYRDANNNVIANKVVSID